MLARALLAFLALPGLVAVAVPGAWLVATGHTQIVYPLGIVPLLVGLFGLLWCVRDFYVAGKGTLAPWSPPEHLVQIGLYRITRNPMYMAVVVLLAGWAWAFGSLALIAYTIAIAVAFHVRVVTGEEPYLTRTFPGEWEDYRSRVPRWFG